MYIYIYIYNTTQSLQDNKCLYIFAYALNDRVQTPILQELVNAVQNDDLNSIKARLEAMCPEIWQSSEGKHTLRRLASLAASLGLRDMLFFFLEKYNVPVHATHEKLFGNDSHLTPLSCSLKYQDLAFELLSLTTVDTSLCTFTGYNPCLGTDVAECHAALLVNRFWCAALDRYMFITSGWEEGWVWDMDVGVGVVYMLRKFLGLSMFLGGVTSEERVHSRAKYLVRESARLVASALEKRKANNLLDAYEDAAQAAILARTAKVDTK